MKWKLFEVFAISADPGAVTALRGRRMELPPNGFGKPADRFIGTHSVDLIYEQLFVY